MEKKRFTGLNRLFKVQSLQMLLNKLDDGTFSEFWGDWKWIFSYSRRYKWVIVLYLVLGIVGSSMTLASAYLGRVLINIIVSREVRRLWLLIVGMILSSLASVFFDSVMSRVSTRISIYVNNDIQAEIFDRIIDAPWTELNNYPDGDLLNRFNSDVDTIAKNAVSWIPNLIINLYTFTATFIVLFRMDATMAFIAVLAAPVLLLVSRFVLRRLRAYRKRVLELNSKMMSFEVETFFNLDMIKSFGIIGHYSRQLRSWQKQYREHNLDYNKFEIKSRILMTAVSTVVAMTAFCYCLFRLWTGQILFGDMTFFLQQRGTLTARFNTLVGTLPGMMNSAVSAHRVRELVELGQEHHDPASLEKMSAMAGDGITVEMEGVSFSYREDSPVYSGSSFISRPGEIVAVLGASGEGKTTLLRMILGLIRPEQGSVTLRGSDGERVPINADLRLLFSYVPQGNTIFSGSVAENMRMVCENATDEQIIAALKTACAWGFVEKLPQGIHTQLGEKGKGLSMGQAQRIAIARAVLRDAPILLLDEATSALDAETERKVLENIMRCRPNKTCIVCTHRPGVLAQCRRVYRITGQAIREMTREEAKEVTAM